MNTTQRYDWEDAIVEAETMGVINKTAANAALRLARVINWVPGDGRPSGLYWANELAYEVVGGSRSTLFRAIKPLKEQGYMVLKNGNLLPLIPESHFDTKDAFLARQQALIDAWKSQNDTSECQIDTTQSQNDTSECQNEHPYSEDTYTEDLLTEDEYTEAVATAPALPSEDSDSSSLYEDDDWDFEWDIADTEEPRKSQNDTEMSDEEIAGSDDEDEEVEEITWGLLYTLTQRAAKDKWWDKDKAKRLLNDCLARKDNYNGTAKSLVDAVVAEYVEEEGDIW